MVRLGFQSSRPERWLSGSGRKSRQRDYAIRRDRAKLKHLLDWRKVQAGDVVFVPAGTVHAIGAGLTICEIQQNSDITYRLYDYGRPRELHLDMEAASRVLVPIGMILPSKASRLGAIILCRALISTLNACGSTGQFTLPEIFRTTSY